MAKVNVDAGLYDRAKRAAEISGYSSVDEFIAHCIENEVQKHKDDTEDQVRDQLKGLGYVE